MMYHRVYGLSRGDALLEHKPVFSIEGYVTNWMGSPGAAIYHAGDEGELDMLYSPTFRHSKAIEEINNRVYQSGKNDL